MKLHQKGYLLVALSQRRDAWDYELVAQTMAEYGTTSRQAMNTIRVALDEMASAGLLARLEEQLDDGTHLQAGKVLFRYGLTDFGRRRMRDTGLLPAEAAP